MGDVVGRSLQCFHEIEEGLGEEEQAKPKVVLKSLKELNGGVEPTLFGDCRIRNQRNWDQSFAYLIDALNTISTQPSLIYRLFERTKVKKDGIHPVWINTNGKWQNIILDDRVPVIQTAQDKTIPLFIGDSRSGQNGIWASLLLKGLVKSMSPNYFQARNGYEPYAMHSLTGAPYQVYDIVNINQR